MLIKMVCPQCGSSMEMDSERDVVFCSYCGTKIANVADKVEISGKVQLDESGKIGNFFKIAESAFKSGNYTEAYNYYLRIKENEPDNLNAEILKGLTAVALSDPGNCRITEGTVAVVSSAQLGFFRKAENIDFIKNLISKVEYITDNQWKLHCDGMHKEKFPSLEKLTKYLELMNTIVSFRSALSLSIGEEIMKKDQKLEEMTKRLILSSIELADESICKLSYVCDYKQIVDKNGKIKTDPVYTKIENPMNKKNEEIIENLKKKFNQVPSTVETLHNFETEIEKNNSIVEEFDNSLKNYFKDNPEDGKKYKHPGLFKRKETIGKIEEKFPMELMDKKFKAEAAKDALKKLSGNKNSFIKKNIL